MSRPETFLVAFGKLSLQQKRIKFREIMSDPDQDGRIVADAIYGIQTAELDAHLLQCGERGGPQAMLDEARNFLRLSVDVWRFV